MLFLCLCRCFSFGSFPRLVFVESFCRVESLSLTGLLVRPVCDAFVVQWEQLKEKYKDSVCYYGRII